MIVLTRFTSQYGVTAGTFHSESTSHDVGRLTALSSAAPLGTPLAFPVSHSRYDASKPPCPRGRLQRIVRWPEIILYLQEDLPFLCMTSRKNRAVVKIRIIRNHVGSRIVFGIPGVGIPRKAPVQSTSMNSVAIQIVTAAIIAQAKFSISSVAEDRDDLVRFCGK